MATVVEVVQPTGPSVIEVTTFGPQGPKGDPGDIAPASVQTVSGTYAVVAEHLRTTRNLVLSGNLTVATMPIISSDISGIMSLVIKQPSSGGPFTVTWPAGIKWANGASAPLMPTPVSSILSVHLFWTGVEWLGAVMGVFV